MATAHINIGSNIGDRLSLIGEAVAAVELAFNAKATCSEPIESEPWGFDSTNSFINIGVNIEVGNLAPEEVLKHLLKAQAQVDSSPHRNADGGYIDRLIDIDLIAIDNVVIDTEELTLPHPRMHLREFVLRPMSELLPSWRHPLLHATVAELLRRL